MSASCCSAGARGEAKPDSDYDIAVFIKDAGTFTDESARLAAITTDILPDTSAVISATPFPAGAYRGRTGFMHELRKDGRDPIKAETADYLVKARAVLADAPRSRRCSFPMSRCVSNWRTVLIDPAI